MRFMNQYSLTRIQLVFVGFCLLGTLPASGQAVSVKDIIHQMQLNEQAIPPFRCLYHHSQKVSREANADVEEDAELIFKVGKIRWTVLDAAGNENVQISDNGKNYRVYSHSQGTETKSQINASNGGFTTFSPLNFGLMIGDTWVSDVVNRNNYTLSKTDNDAKFGEVYILTGEYDNQVYSLSIAPKYGYLCVRAVYGDTRSEERFTYETTEAKQFGKFWLPMSGHMRFGEGKIDEGAAIVEHTVLVSKYKFDPVDDAVFKPNFRSGSLLREGKESYRLGEDGNRIPLNLKQPEKPHVDPFGWLFMASVTTLLVLTVLAYVRWKRNQWAKQV